MALQLRSQCWKSVWGLVLNKCFGHISRMEIDRLPARALYCHVTGEQNQGRQAKKWMENINEDFDLRNIQFKDVVASCKDRTAWRQLISSTSSSLWWRTRKKKKKKMCFILASSAFCHLICILRLCCTLQVIFSALLQIYDDYCVINNNH